MSSEQMSGIFFRSQCVKYLSNHPCFQFNAALLNQARASAAMVMTPFSQNISVSAPHGLMLMRVIFNSLRPGDILQNSYSALFLSIFCDLNWIGMCYNDTTVWLFDTGSGNGLVPLGNKPLHDPMFPSSWCVSTSLRLIGLIGIIN